MRAQGVRSLIIIINSNITITLFFIPITIFICPVSCLIFFSSRKRTSTLLLVPLNFVERKPSLKLLVVTFQSDPCYWDLHLDNILSKDSSRLYILSVGKFYGLPLDHLHLHLHLLFISVILPIFTYAVEVWGCVYSYKYLSRIDRLFKKAFKLGYCNELFSIENIALKDTKLWDKITHSNSTTALDCR